MRARVAEDLAEQLAGAVDDAGLAGESPGADATNPTTLTTRVTESRPTSESTAASALSAQTRASALARLRGDLGADLAGRGSSPSTIGSWPEV